MSYQIVSSKGHYEVYVNGEFFCSADTLQEAESEIKEYQSIDGKGN